MAHEKNHDYHILDPSILPFLGAVGAFVMLFGAVLYGLSERSCLVCSAKPYFK